MTTGLRTTGYIYDPQTGHSAAWLDSNGAVHSSVTGEKIYTATRDGKLYDLDGTFTGLHLADLNGPRGANEVAAFSRLKKLAKPSA
jgi:hypothetical protein